MSVRSRLQLNDGYAVKLEVEIEGNTILFEHDEERNWRALIPYNDIAEGRKTNAELLKAVKGMIEEITK